MKIWIAVYVTIYQNYPQHTNARFFYDDNELDLHLDHRLSYEEGMKALRKAEKLLNKPAKMIINPYSSGVCYKEVFGYINWE